MTSWDESRLGFLCFDYGRESGEGRTLNSNFQCLKCLSCLLNSSLIPPQLCFDCIYTHKWMRSSENWMHSNHKQQCLRAILPYLPSNERWSKVLSLPLDFSPFSESELLLLLFLQTAAAAPINGTTLDVMPESLILYVFVVFPYFYWVSASCLHSVFIPILTCIITTLSSTGVLFVPLPSSIPCQISLLFCQSSSSVLCLQSWGIPSPLL